MKVKNLRSKNTKIKVQIMKEKKFRSVRTVRVVNHLPKISGLSHRTRLDSTIGDKSVETLFLNRVGEQKYSHPSPVPSIQSRGVCCFLWVGRTRAQHCTEGMGEESYISFF